MPSVAIFRTSDPESFLRAVTLLEEANIKFQVEDINERGTKNPLRVQWIFVDPEDADEAGEVVSSIPSTYIMLTNKESSTRPDRALVWITIIPFIVLIIYIIIRAIMNAIGT